MNAMETESENKADDNNMQSPFINLSRNILNCTASSKKAMHEFYVNKLGMKTIEETNDRIIYGFEHPNKRDACLELQFDKNFKQIAPNQNDAYWKIGIVAPNVDALRELLISQSIAVSKASQFLDIG